jgi:hypothetical protein
MIDGQKSEVLVPAEAVLSLGAHAAIPEEWTNKLDSLLIQLM